jgi:hypothetical protein
VLDVVFRLLKVGSKGLEDRECLDPKLECEKGMEIPMFDKQTNQNPFLEDIAILKEEKYTCRGCKHE